MFEFGHEKRQSSAASGVKMLLELVVVLRKHREQRVRCPCDRACAVKEPSNWQEMMPLDKALQLTSSVHTVLFHRLPSAQRAADASNARCLHTRWYQHMLPGSPASLSLSVAADEGTPEACICAYFLVERGPRVGVWDTDGGRGRGPARQRPARLSGP